MDNILKTALKEAITIEVKECFASRPAVVLDEVLDLFLLLLEAPIVEDNIELSGLGNRVSLALKKLLLDGASKDEKATYLADLAKVEQYLKKIKFFVDMQDFAKIQSENRGLAGLLTSCGLNPENKNLDRSDLKNHNYLDHIGRVYQYRNSDSHNTPVLSTKAFGDLVQSILMLFVYATYLNRVKLKKALSALIIDPIPTFHGYCDTVISEFRERLGRFIHLSSKEDITLAGSYVSEYLLSQGVDKDITVREGNVYELRKKKVPEKRMMIWAEAGLGKSTTLEYLAYMDAQERKKNLNANIPVLVPLGLLTDPAVTIKVFISKKLSIETKLLEQLLENGKVNLFFDGLNEIPKDTSNTLRTLRVKEIEAIVKNSKETFIIISNRPQDVNLFENIPVFFIQKMNDGQIADFIDKYTGSNKDVAKLITAKLKDDLRIKDVVRSPLMLSRLIEIVKMEGVIPESEGMIIDKFIKSLYKREKVEKKDINFNDEIIHKLLSSLASHSLDINGTNAGLTRNQILNHFLKVKKEYGFDMDLIYCLDIACALNILEKRENSYLFVHQSYQDYYVSEYLKILFEE
jgi:predicted NACHT family NTPase